jgi:hypothetical protein
VDVTIADLKFLGSDSTVPGTQKVSKKSRMKSLPTLALFHVHPQQILSTPTLVGSEADWGDQLLLLPDGVGMASVSEELGSRVCCWLLWLSVLFPRLGSPCHISENERAVFVSSVLSFLFQEPALPSSLTCLGAVEVLHPHRHPFPLTLFRRRGEGSVDGTVTVPVPSSGEASLWSICGFLCKWFLPGLALHPGTSDKGLDRDNLVVTPGHGVGEGT